MWGVVTAVGGAPPRVCLVTAAVWRVPLCALGPPQAKDQITQSATQIAEEGLLHVTEMNRAVEFGHIRSQLEVCLLRLPPSTHRSTAPALQWDSQDVVRAALLSLKECRLLPPPPPRSALERPL